MDELSGAASADDQGLNPAYVVGSTLPSSIGRCADLYHEVRELRLAMDKEVAAVKARESEIKQHIIDTLSKSDDTGAAGLKYRAQVTTKEEYNIADWSALTGYILENDRFDLLQKRLSKEAVRDVIAAMKDEGKALPGVATVLVPDVSITKV